MLRKTQTAAISSSSSSSSSSPSSSSSSTSALSTTAIVIIGLSYTVSPVSLQESSVVWRFHQTLFPKRTVIKEHLEEIERREYSVEEEEEGEEEEEEEEDGEVPFVVSCSDI
ncbi:hypothetical protein SprV_0401446200 [Sparganum proliferum]